MPDERQWQVQVFRHTSSQGRVMMQAKNKNGTILPVYAQVCEGAIILPSVKIRLDISGGLNNKEENKSNHPAPLVEVRRRRDTISVGGGGGMRRVHLKFRNEAECKEFSDLFVKLNPPMVWSRKKDRSTQPDESGDALSYVVRLLNEPEFEGYVNNLERYLLSSEDGQQMLDAFV
jgi:hypothetical protein